MINLLYIILMALLAINISPEALDGYEEMSNSLCSAMETVRKENMDKYHSLERLQHNNGIKYSDAFKKATQLITFTDSLCALIEQNKTQIALKADGVKGTDCYQLIDKNNKKAVECVLGQNKGIETIQSALIRWNEGVKAIVETQNNQLLDIAKFEELHVQKKTAVVAIAMLTNLQYEIRNRERENLNSIIENVDTGDLRVNKYEAIVKTQSNTVLVGDKYEAKVVLATVDTTQQPTIMKFDGRKYHTLTDGIFTQKCDYPGSYVFQGMILTTNNNGDSIRCPFAEPYTVMQPNTYISADLMNVLYENYNNPITVSFGGAAYNNISVTMDGGKITKSEKEGAYLAVPDIGQEKAVIKVFTDVDSKLLTSHEFRIRRIPDPQPFITVNKTRIRSGKVSKKDLLSVTKLEAAVDDGLLDIPFKVTSFDMITVDRMGDAIPARSLENTFSSQQQSKISKMEKGGRFYITHVVVIGPDGIERRLNNSMEIIIN